jgi:hypothetical protein
MSLLEQMGNLGTEVARAARAKESGDQERCEGAFNRALELFELTIVDDRWRGPRRREICMVRELFIDCIAGDNTYGESADSLDRYHGRAPMSKMLRPGIRARRPRGPVSVGD